MTTASTIKTIQSIDEQMASLERQREEAFKLMAPLQAKLVRLGNKAAALQTKKDKLLLSKGKVDWAWLLETYPESMVKYEFRRKQFRKLGLIDPFGHWQDTKQTAIRIGLNKQENKSHFYRNDKQLKAVKMLLPFIKANDKGCKKIDIFEHSLSSSGNYWMEFYEAPRDVKSNPKGYDYCIQIAQTHGTPVKFNTIEEAFKYVSENLWYQSGNPNDAYDSDSE